MSGAADQANFLPTTIDPRSLSRDAQRSGIWRPNALRTWAPDPDACGIRMNVGIQRRVR
jgi:hypothetical protein